jgi:hypothetical protein
LFGVGIEGKDWRVYPILMNVFWYQITARTTWGTVYFGIDIVLAGTLSEVMRSSDIMLEEENGENPVADSS